MQLQKAKENDSPTLKIEKTIYEFDDNGFPSLPFGHGSLRHLYLIETDEALALIQDNPPNLRVVNAQWYIPGMGDATAEFKAARLSKTA